MARIGIIGTGWGARVQVPIFREAGLEVVAIAGHSPQKTRSIAAELEVEAVDSWRELLERNIDVVSIVTPPSEHLEMARVALAAGKHVLSEKPTALNAEEAEQMVQAARSQPKCIALIDHELRFLPSWREARRRVPELGGARYVEVRYASPSRGDRRREWNWWSNAAQGGGVSGAVGSHFVDGIRYLAGDVAAVQASVNTVIRERPLPGSNESREVTSDDLTFMNLRLTNGARATLSLSACASGPDEPSVLTIHCEEGALRLTGEELFFARRGSPYERIVGDEPAKRPGNSFGGAFGTGTLYLGLALKAALDEGSTTALSPAATFEDGLAQQRVLDAARRSEADGGRWESV